ncbi:hypothetical protein RB595_004679 [Gaeumannomyces hyphopodioides]
MSAALTFGSVGDILAICQIAIELGKALKGAADEYRDLRETLDSFSRVLLHVIATYERREQASPSLLALERDIGLAVHECGGLIKAALDKLTGRYGDSLGHGGSGNKLKDAYKRIEFTLREKDDLASLRRKLSETTARISLLSVLAATHLAGAGTAAILDRIDCAQKSACAALGIIALLLEQLAQGVANIPVLLFGWITLSGLRLDPTRDLPVHIEDAMGNLVDLQLDWLHDWRDFDYMLCRRFEELRLTGIEKVRKQQYALEDDCSGKDLCRSRPLKAWLRRGMKVNMSIIFRATKQDLARSQCPRCHTPVVAREGRAVQCETDHCGMWFRVSERRRRIDEYGLQGGEGGGGSAQEGNDQSIPDQNHTIEAQGRCAADKCRPADFRRVRLLKEVDEDGKWIDPDEGGKRIDPYDYDKYFDLDIYEEGISLDQPQCPTCRYCRGMFPSHKKLVRHLRFRHRLPISAGAARRYYARMITIGT